MKLVKLNEIPEKGVSHNVAVRKQVFVENGEIPGITNFARAVFPPSERVGDHLHNDMTEVFSVESGCGEIRIDDVGYVFAAGTTVVVEPGEVHEIINTGNTDLVVTYFGVLASA